MKENKLKEIISLLIGSMLVAFAISIADPPPIEIIQSQSFSLNKEIASNTFSYLGFGAKSQ